jgi:hypothetical protein
MSSSTSNPGSLSVTSESSEVKPLKLKISYGFNYWNQGDVSDDTIGDIINNPKE